MKIPISCRVPHRLASLLLICMSFHAFAQDACDCPSIHECDACLDGITSLSLKYAESQGTTVNVAINDQQNTLYAGAVNPGDTIVINGSPSSGKFVGNKLTIRENDIVTATLDVSCEQPIYRKSVFASFIVIAGQSKTGGEICCDPATVERIPPVISDCPADIRLELPEGACSTAIHWAEPSAGDNCEVLSFTTSHPPGTSFSSGTTEVVYTAIDKFGTSTTCAFKVILHEAALPVIENCPLDISAAADATCEARVTWTPPVATDNCGVSSLVSSHNSGDIFPHGATVVTYTATDPSGNAATCQFTVTVGDESPPVFSDCPADISLTADATGEAEGHWSPPTAWDACSPVFLTSTHEPGSSFPKGTTEVLYTATDVTGNTSTCAFKVNVAYSEVDLSFQKVVTPDGDGINDQWLLRNIENFRDNNVTIVDRWGGVIFTGTGYDNENVVWKGQNSSGTIVPTGTYFYAIKVNTGNGTVVKRGFIELIRSR